MSMAVDLFLHGRSNVEESTDVVRVDTVDEGVSVGMTKM